MVIMRREFIDFRIKRFIGKRVQLLFLNISPSNQDDFFANKNNW